ncbi:restriction endonuclease subunit S [Prevotella copri]|uniref:restriction endonuclease subunit S n=1 Tax=Segatella copri TaxID=165179 RepID=UPI0012912426|nr:restriction endonuclease subunit S [Segatella copri]MQO26265.1 restriction endonuclease subunit S [Segatella copri]MQO51303.1 restriction endonuclease subunit S [Segatella copri]
MHPNVPHLRFPEFHGEWEKCKVSDVLNFYSTNSLSWDQLEYGTDNMLNLHYGLIHVGLPTMVDLSKDILPAIKKENEPKNFELCKEGDIAFADASEDTNEVAKAIEFYTLEDKAVVCGLHTIHGRDKSNKTVVGYKGYAFSSTAFHHQIRRIAQGTKIYSISAKNFAECYIGIPSKEEQTKIAKLLRLIDERIATQSKLIEKLESLIKGIAQKIVRCNKPNVRLSECLECKSSTLQESDVYEQGTYPVYGANGIVGYLDNYNTESEAVYIIKDGSGVGTVSYVTGKCSATGTLNTLQEKDGYSLQYFYYLLKVFNFEPYKTGMAIPHIYFKDYGNALFFCPSYTEQLQYARLFFAIDSKLSAEQNIKTNISLQKQYLLREMFI